MSPMRPIQCAFDPVGVAANLSSVPKSFMFLKDGLSTAVLGLEECNVFDPRTVGVPWPTSFPATAQCKHWKEANEAATSIIEKSAIPEAKRGELLEAGITVAINMFPAAGPAMAKILAEASVLIFLFDDVIDSNATELMTIIDSALSDLVESDTVIDRVLWKNEIFRDFAQRVLQEDRVVGPKFLSGMLEWVRKSRQQLPRDLTFSTFTSYINYRTNEFLIESCVLDHEWKPLVMNKPSVESTHGLSPGHVATLRVTPRSFDSKYSLGHALAKGIEDYPNIDSMYRTLADRGHVAALPADSPLLQPAFTPGRYGFFPIRFGIYLIGPAPDSEAMQWLIGIEDQGTLRPSYAVTTHKSVKLQISLHSGPEHTSPLLARGGLGGAMQSTFLIALPCYVPGANGPVNKIEKMVHGKEIRTDTATFQVPVYNHGIESVEGFEWRSPTLQFGASQQQIEYKLTRTGNGEVVGTYLADPTAITTGRFGTFQFAGSGATGQLGPYWTLMTVMTLIRLVQAKTDAEAAVDQMLKAGGKLATAGLAMGI
ncbi:hypothetical protein PWT90_06879 [Aphanocladium album]|nr:hypothetical protein PWT90_06879 [Aphanocladium album]